MTDIQCNTKDGPIAASGTEYAELFIQIILDFEIFFSAKIRSSYIIP